VEKVYVFAVGGHHHPGNFVEANTRLQNVAFRGVGQCAPLRIGKRCSHLRKAPRSEGMQVRVPGRDERQSKSMSYARSGNSDVAWARDMNDVGSKFADSLEHLRVMPNEKQIELQVFIEVECQRSSIQLKNFHRAIP
jgi:hypothetical protein